MTKRTIDLIGGFILLFLSGGLYFFNWYSIFFHASYYPKVMVFAATMMIVSVGLIIFGGYRTERINRGEDISNLEGLKLLTPKWWGILVAAIVFALLNLIYIEWFYG